MSYRPYPNADRALNNLRRRQAAYRYGRVPQRYVLGLDPGTAPVPIRYVIGLGHDVGEVRAMTEDEVSTLRQRPRIVGLTS